MNKEINDFNKLVSTRPQELDRHLWPDPDLVLCTLDRCVHRTMSAILVPCA